MSTRIPTDAFGRSVNLSRLPFSSIESRPVVDYDKVFINADGDKMEGALDMNKNKLTNIPTPTNPLDAATKEYVDTLKQKVIESLSKDLDDTEKKINKEFKRNRDQDLALKNLIKQLQKKIDSDTQIKIITGKISNTKNIPTLVVTWDKGDSITKNIIILQILIESDNDCWLDIQALGNQYGVHVYERYNNKKQRNEYHISATQSFPPSWKRNIRIFCRILH